MDRNSTCRKTENRHVVWIASKCSNVLPDPLECGNLVHKGVAAFVFFRMFFAQCRECKMTKAAETIINRCQDHALFSKCISCRAGVGATPTCETASVDPNHHRPF